MNRLIVPDIFGGVTAFFTGKDPGADLRRIGDTFRIEEKQIYLPIQRHTDKVLVIESSLDPALGDAVVTRREGILIGVQVADCVPVLLYEKTKGVIAAVHAGWRGTAESILKKTVRVMIERFACSEQNISVAIGPSIRGCSYEVGRDVAQAVERACGFGPAVPRGDRFFLDLALANKRQAESIGIPGANIWISPDCTFCNPDRFFSYRYSKGSTGRQGGFIGKKLR